MSEIHPEDKDPNFYVRIITGISDETGISFEMVGHIQQSVTKKRKKHVAIDSKNASQFIILDLINNDNGSVRDILTHNKIHSSDDFGLVVKRLCEEGLLIQEQGDNFDDFNGQFKTETIDDFIKLHKLKKDHDWYKIICYSLYILGTAIVIASYIIPVTHNIGWAGWLVGMIGWVLLTFRNSVVGVFNKVANRTSH